MPDFQPNKLTVEYRDGHIPFGPVIPRYYTLTHSDDSGKLFLTIGNSFAWDQVSTMRDEVLGEWKFIGDTLYFWVYLHIDEGQFTYEESKKRNEVFRRELPLALSSIRYGDQLLFHQYPMLDYAPIIVHFISIYPDLATQENWGSFAHYAIQQTM